MTVTLGAGHDNCLWILINQQVEGQGVWQGKGQAQLFMTRTLSVGDLCPGEASARCHLGNII